MNLNLGILNMNFGLRIMKFGTISIIINSGIKMIYFGGFTFFLVTMSVA